MIASVLRAIARQAFSLILIFVIVLLIGQVAPRLAALVLVLLASLQMLWAFHADQAFTKLSTALPGLMTLMCYAIQVATAPVAVSLEGAGGILPGLLIGWLAGRRHRVYLVGGRLFVRRSFVYVVMWTLSFAVAQIGTILQVDEAVTWGLAAGAFTTAMNLALSATLLRRRLTMRVHARPSIPGAASAAALALVLLATVSTAWTMDAVEAAAMVISSDDLPGHTRELGSPEQIRHLREMNTHADWGRERNLTPPTDMGVALFQRWSSTTSSDGIAVGMWRFADATAAMQFARFHQEHWPLISQWDGDPVQSTVAGCGDLSAMATDGITAVGFVVRGSWLLRIDSYLFATSGINTPVPDSPPRSQLVAMQQQLVESLLRKGESRMGALADTPDGASAAQMAPSGASAETSVGAQVPRIMQQLRSDGLSDAAVAAGLATALLQLLCGATLTVALAAAQVAGAAASFTQTAGTLTLSGADATRWLMAHDYIKNGQPTERFRNWRNSTPDAAADPGGLDVVAGDWDFASDQLGQVTIVVRADVAPVLSPLPLPLPEMSLPRPVPEPEPPEASPTLPAEPPERDPLVRIPSDRHDGWWPTDGVTPKPAAPAAPAAPATPVEPPEAVPGSVTARLDLDQLKMDMAAIANDLKQQGCFVVNPLLDKDPVIFVHGAQIALNLTWDAMYGALRRQAPAGMLPPLQGITCGEYVGKAEKPVAEALRKHFGNDPRVQLEVVSFEEKSQAAQDKDFAEHLTLGKEGALDDWVDSLNQVNHQLLRVTLPDGTQHAVDFWDHARGDGPIVRPWNESVTKWRAGISGLDDKEFSMAEPRVVKL